MSSPIRVLVADSQPIFCVGMEATLALADDVQLIGKVHQLSQLYAYESENPPDVLLLATNLMAKSLLETIVACKQRFAGSKILILFTDADGVCLRQVTPKEVEGCLLKTKPPHKFLQAIQAVVQGDTWFSESFWEKTMQPDATPVPLSGLEERLSCFLITEMTIEEIAAALYMSDRTLKRHLQEFYAKFGVKGRIGAVTQIIKLGLA